MVTDEEISTTIQSIKAFKAPGPNGLHAGFFQRFWYIVEGSIREEVKQVFRDRNIPEYLNKTNIVLIPKNQGPESITHYRPISLCNLVYKIVSKILVGRIRPLLDQIVSPCQDGLLLYLQIQAQAILIELDAKAVVDAFNLQNYSNSTVSSIMDNCRHLTSQILRMRVRHVYKEANRCANFLAKLDTSLKSDFVVFSSPPVGLIHMLEVDAYGLAINRLCPDPFFAVQCFNTFLFYQKQRKERVANLSSQGLF